MSGNLSTLGIGGGFIKSIQRGVISITAGNTSATATITSVNTSKSILFDLGASVTNNTNESDARLALTNATTVTATRQGNTGTTEKAFQVVEYY